MIRPTEYKKMVKSPYSVWEEMLFSATAIALYFGTLAWATPVLWEGRAPRTYGKTDVNGSLGPYYTYVVVPSIIPPSDLKFWDRSGVKGTQNASHVSAPSCQCLAAARSASEY
jgi:hypothetical protein